MLDKNAPIIEFLPFQLGQILFKEQVEVKDFCVNSVVFGHTLQYSYRGWWRH
jgi:hypothetical protein